MSFINANDDGEGDGDDTEPEVLLALSASQITALIADGYVELDISMSWADIESTITGTFDEPKWYAALQLYYPADTNLANNGMFFIATVNLFDYQFVAPPAAWTSRAPRTARTGGTGLTPTSRSSRCGTWDRRTRAGCGRTRVMR